MSSAPALIIDLTSDAPAPAPAPRQHILPSFLEGIKYVVIWLKDDESFVAVPLNNVPEKLLSDLEYLQRISNEYDEESRKRRKRKAVIYAEDLLEIKTFSTDYLTYACDENDETYFIFCYEDNHGRMHEIEFYNLYGKEKNQSNFRVFKENAVKVITLNSKAFQF